MLTLISIGAALVAVTIAIHAIGTTAWVNHLLKRHADRDGRWRKRSVLGVLGMTGVVLVLLHSIEVSLWALTYLAIPSITTLESIGQAFYFSFVTFTTLGYGDITLE